MEVLDAQPGRRQGRDDLAHAVLPGVLDRRLHRHVRVRVGLGVEHQRLRGRPVGGAEAQLGGRVVVVEAGERVGLGDVEEAARANKWATTSAQRGTSGSQLSTPKEVNTTSKSPSGWPGATTSETTKRASRPVAAARSRACSDGPLREVDPGRPGPRLAQDSVSSPKWHCRWSRSLPATSPTSSTSSGRRSRRPDRQPSTS